MAYHNFLLLIFLTSLAVQCQSRDLTNKSLSLNSISEWNAKTKATGKQWAVLVAGSNGYYNYRHQADVCHAYQVLKKGGLKDENIIVFMYDDIAHDPENPTPGVIINKPNGPDVYKGVPKDYTGEHCTAKNFYNVLLGNKNALTGGSQKVLKTGPNDHIFIYYADHGGPGVVSMPAGGDVYAKDLIKVLKKKAKVGTYKDIVFYMEACESGSMFEGLLPKDINIYAMTASNAEESSYAAYCSEYNCLGDLFSVSWLEDSDTHDLSKETLNAQYRRVKKRTILGVNLTVEIGRSHVMQYGNVDIANQVVATYIGTNPKYHHARAFADDQPTYSSFSPSNYDATLHYLQTKYDKAPKESNEKMEAQKKLSDEIKQRKVVDNNMNEIATILMGNQNGIEVLKMVRSPGEPLVDDWDCLKEMVKTYEEECGVLSTYGKKYTRVMANICNAGFNVQQMKVASNQACHA
ncbi:hypothetical protein ACFE04_031526 [Oxalis oulophora]